jgi:rhodanese-related sulfurtransferase
MASPRAQYTVCAVDDTGAKMGRGEALRGLALGALRAIRAAIDDEAPVAPAPSAAVALTPQDVTLEAARVLHLLGIGEELRLVDLRGDAELVRDGLVEGAERLEEPGALLDEGDVVLVCEDGQRSAALALQLRAAGRGRFWAVDRGVRGWVSAGGGVIPVDGEIA